MREVPSIPVGLEPKLRNLLSAIRESLNSAITNINANSEGLNGIRQWIMPAIDANNDLTIFSQAQINAALESATGADGAAGIAARAVSLTTPNQSFTYDTNGANPSPSTSVITATIFNTVGVVYYEFFLNDVSTGTATTSNTYTYTPKSTFTGMPDKLEVQIREDGLDGAIKARDQMTMVGLKAGSHGITVMLSNEAHTLPRSTAGVVTYTGSGTKINVWEGATALTEDSSSPYANSTFRVTTVATSIAPGSITGTGTTTLTYGDANSMTTSPAKIDFTIIAKRQDGTEITIAKQQSLSYSQAGAVGADAVLSDLSNDNHTVPTDSSGSNGNFTGCATTMSVFIGSSDDSANWTYAVTKATGVTCTEAITSRTQTVTAMTTDTGTVTIVASKYGYANQTQVFSISKAKSGVAYQINLSDNSVRKSAAGVLSPTTLTLTASKIDVSSVTAYSGRFKIYLNGSATATYTSAADEASKAYTVTATDTTIKCELYLAGGTTTLVDAETVLVVADGGTGPTGARANFTTYAATGTLWTSGATYTAGQQIYYGLNWYTATAGTSGTVAPIHASGTVTATGGTATFAYATPPTWTANVDTVANTAITSMVGSGGVIIVGDEVTICWPNTTSPTYVLTKYASAVGIPATTATWTPRGQVIDGNLLVSGSVKASSLQANTAAVSGSTMTGSGGVINAAGTFALGNTSGNISYNGTTMTLNGNVVATGNINANAVTAMEYYSSSNVYNLPIPASTPLSTTASTYGAQGTPTIITYGGFPLAVVDITTTRILTFSCEISIFDAAGYLSFFFKDVATGWYYGGGYITGNNSFTTYDSDGLGTIRATSYQTYTVTAFLSVPANVSATVNIEASTWQGRSGFVWNYPPKIRSIRLTSITGKR